MTPGKFISIEGIEGAGKSTVLLFIRDHLVKAKKEVALTREPGGTDIAEAIRKILLYTPSVEAMDAQTELLLMFASRAEHIAHRIRPALQAGQWVVSDRYVDASYAYQGGGRGMAVKHIATLDQMIVGDCYPQLTLLLDVPPEIGMKRAEKRISQKDRIEQEHIDFFSRVRDAYLERAKQDPARIKTIDASQELPHVQQQIREALEAFLASG